MNNQKTYPTISKNKFPNENNYLPEIVNKKDNIDENGNSLNSEYSNTKIKYNEKGDSMMEDYPQLPTM